MTDNNYPGDSPTDLQFTVKQEPNDTNISESDDVSQPFVIMRTVEGTLLNAECVKQRFVVIDGVPTPKGASVAEELPEQASAAEDLDLTYPLTEVKQEPLETISTENNNLITPITLETPRDEEHVDIKVECEDFDVDLDHKTNEDHTSENALFPCANMPLETHSGLKQFDCDDSDKFFIKEATVAEGFGEQASITVDIDLTNSAIEEVKQEPIESTSSADGDLITPSTLKIPKEEVKVEFEDIDLDNVKIEVHTSRDAVFPLANITTNTTATNMPIMQSGKNQFNCLYCEKLFTGKDNLHAHLLTHSDFKPFKCDQCGKSFKHKRRFTAHLLIHSDFKPFKCDQCTKSFKYEDFLKTHLLAHSGSKIFECYQCDNCYRLESSLKAHLLTHSNPFQCDQCGKCFEQRSILKKHLLTSCGLKPYKCNQCGNRFVMKESLARHLLTHTGIMPFKCDHCGNCFTHESYLRRHLLIHSGLEPFKCNQCGKCFRSKGGLTTHSLTHSGLKPFKCNQCGKYFSSKFSLTSHLLLHTGIKPFKCDQCGHSFIRMKDLAKHSLTHSGIRPFKCDHCDKCFAQNGILNRHLLSHFGKKPFKCDQCGKPFNYKSSLKRHMLTHSGVKKKKGA